MCMAERFGVAHRVDDLEKSNSRVFAKTHVAHRVDDLEKMPD